MSTGDTVFYTAMLGVIPVMLLTYTLSGPASYFEMRSKNLSRFIAITALLAPVSLVLSGVMLFTNHSFIVVKVLVLLQFVCTALGLTLAVGRGIGGRYRGQSLSFYPDTQEYWDRKDREREQKRKKKEEGD